MEDSLLGRIPGEIRNRIYELTLNPPEGIHVYVEGPNAQIRSLPTPNKVLALTRTCREIHRETQGYKFANTKFRFHNEVFGSPMKPRIDNNPLTIDHEMVWQYVHNWFSNFRQWSHYMISKGQMPSEVEIVLDGHSQARWEHRSITVEVLAYMIHHVSREPTSSPSKYTIKFAIPYAQRIEAPPKLCTCEIAVPRTTSVLTLENCVKQGVEDKRREVTEAVQTGKLSMKQFSCIQANLLLYERVLLPAIY